MLMYVVYGERDYGYDSNTFIHAVCSTRERAEEIIQEIIETNLDYDVVDYEVFTLDEYVED